jgi:hypothetical protein
LRLAIVSLILSTLVWILSEHHVASAGAESRLFTMFVGTALFRAALVALFYLAMEPMIRRRWPETLIPWTRLLNGEWSDPLVGRDILVGFAVGAALASLNFLRAMTPQWLGQPTTDLFSTVPPGVLGPGVPGSGAGRRFSLSDRLAGNIDRFLSLAIALPTELDRDAGNRTCSGGGVVAHFRYMDSGCPDSSYRSLIRVSIGAFRSAGNGRGFLHKCDE